MPEPASARLGLVAPSSTDLVSQGDDIIRSLVAQLDAVAAGYIIGTIGARPAAAAGNAGKIYLATDTGGVSISTGSAWQSIMQAFELGHTFLVAGEIRVPVGQGDIIPQIFVPVLAGQTVKLKRARYGIVAGTSATFKVARNGVDVTGLTGLVAGQTVAETALGTPVVMANNDRLHIIVTAISGVPQNLSCTLVLEHTA
jgi:hypothetical protein